MQVDIEFHIEPTELMWVITAVVIITIIVGVASAKRNRRNRSW